MDMTLSQALVVLVLLLVGLFGLWLGRQRSSGERTQDVQQSEAHKGSESSDGLAQREPIAGELGSSSVVAADAGVGAGADVGQTDNPPTFVDAERSKETVAQISELGTIDETGLPDGEVSPQTQSLLDAELARGSEELKLMVELNQSVRTQQRDVHPLDAQPGQADSSESTSETTSEATVDADAAELARASIDERTAGNVSTSGMLAVDMSDGETGNADSEHTDPDDTDPDHTGEDQTVPAVAAVNAFHGNEAELPEASESPDTPSERHVTVELLEHERQNHRAQRRSLEARLLAVEQQRDEARRERAQHLDALRDRDATIVALQDEAAYVVDLQDKLAQIETSRTAEVNERQRIEVELRDTHLEALERLEQEQEQQLAQQRQLEVRATTAERERDLAQCECEKTVEALRHRDATILALSEEASRGAELQNALAQSEIALATATTEREQSEEQLRSAHEGALRRLQETEQHISELDSALAEKDAIAKRADMAVEHALTLEQQLAQAQTDREDAETRHHDAQTQRDKMRAELAARDKRIVELERSAQTVQQLQSELAQRKSELKRAQQDASRLTQVSAELAASRVRVNELNMSLSSAEARAAQMGNTDIELRRVRSELAALEGQRASAELHASRSEQRERDSDARANHDTSRQAQLDSELVRRNQRIAELEQRLAGAALEPAPEPARKPTIEPTRQSEARPSPSPSPSAEQATKPRARTPLFKRPQETDDLQKIKGVGPVMEYILNELGITTFKQIAGFTPDDISRVSAEIDTFPGRIERDDWIGGAKREYEKKYREPTHS
jgi:predicted flap endonuclease-1-like 5' DNA nuclease